MIVKRFTNLKARTSSRMASALARRRASVVSSPWELAAETIAVKIRWFGLLVGYLLVNLSAHDGGRLAILNAILTVGLAYTLLDTYFSMRGRVFLGRSPLGVSLMEGLFIGLLCYFDAGLNSPFRYYYFLSLICCAIRHTAQVTYATCALHCLSYGLLYLALPAEGQRLLSFTLTLVILGWVTWASSAMALLLKRVGDYLGQLNQVLQENKEELEARIAERTRELNEAQAHVLHQEKMAAFGLLAAGIAHEVGNPLTSISSMVQILQRRDGDPYTLDKLALVSGQLQRIRGTLRELIEFSRPASSIRTRVALDDILDEALNIAKYYKRMRGRIPSPALPADLPPLFAVRDQLVQVFLNLVLNALDATDRDGRIDVLVTRRSDGVEVSVRDSGSGIAAEDAARLFQPYFTTKKHGTGLGLFVTRQLVAEHGGTVTFESRLGAGTTFHVFLPLDGEPAALAAGYWLAEDSEKSTW
jgi:signal transduction histidine kinase